MSETKTTRVTKKGISDRAHEQDLNVSKDAKDYIAKIKDYDKAMKVVDLAGIIAQTARRKTIQKSHAQTVLKLFNQCAQMETSGTRATMKGVKAYIVDKDGGLGMNSSKEARTLIVSVGDEVKAKRVAELASEIAKSIGLKTIKDQHVTVVLEAICHVDGTEVVVEETATVSKSDSTPSKKKTTKNAPAKKKKTTKRKKTTKKKKTTST